MKSVLVIGIGRFGSHLIRKYIELGAEVMAADFDEKRVEEVEDIATSAYTGDCTNIEVLKELGAANFDICFVCIGENFQNSLEITSLLIELGAKKVISKANTDIQAKFLRKCGAEVIFPERDSAEKLAIRYNSDNIFDFVEITEDTGIFEIPVFESWIGKTILKTDARRKYGINILAIKKGMDVKALPGAEYEFVEEDHIIILGCNEDVAKILKKLD